MWFVYRLIISCRTGPREDDTMRHGCFVPFEHPSGRSIEDVPRRQREVCLRAVLEWAIRHPIHEALPEWEGKSYLPLEVDIDDVKDEELPALRERLTKAGVRFVDEIMLHPSYFHEDKNEEDEADEENE